MRCLAYIYVTGSINGSTERAAIEGQSASAYLSALLRTLCEINVAHHVDVDGIRPDSGMPSTSPQYMQMVEKARYQVRILEAATQALYDDGMAIFMAVQSLGRAELLDLRERAAAVTSAESTAPVVRSNCGLVAQTLETLLAIGHDQASISQGDYRNSIEWRRSRINMADTNASIAALTSRMADIPAEESEYVDLEDAFNNTRTAPIPDVSRSETTLYNNSHQQVSQSSLEASDRTRSDSIGESETPTWSNGDPSEGSTFIGPSERDPDEEQFEGDLAVLADEDDRECARRGVSCRAHLTCLVSCTSWEVAAPCSGQGQQTHEDPRNRSSSALHQQTQRRTEAMVPAPELRPGRDSHRPRRWRSGRYTHGACRAPNGA